MCFRLVLVLFIALVNVTCARESEVSTPPIEVNLKSGGECLTDMSKQITDFVDGKLGPSEVAGFWDCLSNAVAEFQRITTGDHGDSYSPQALRQFLQKYFIKNKFVSDDLMYASMELKRVLLSGSSQYVTRAELTRLRELFSQLKTASLILQPHTKILFLQQQSATDREVRVAAASMQSAVDILGTWLYQRQQPYSFEQFGRLIEALNNWVNKNGDPSTSFTAIQQALALLPDAKQLILSGDRSKIDGQEWLSLTNVLAKSFYLYVASHYSFADNIEVGFTRQVLPESLNEVVDILNQSVNLHNQGGIPRSEFHAFFTQLVKTGWLSKDFTVQAFDEVVRWLLKRPLGDGVNEPEMMMAKHVAVLRTHVEYWMILIRSPNMVTRAPVVDHFRKLLAETPSMEWDKEGRLVFNARPPRFWSEANRRHMVMPYVAMRLLKDAYSSEPVDYIHHEQMDTAVGEVLPLLQNFGWLLTSDMSLSNKRFRESDLFTLGGNGDDLLQLGEAMRYVGFVTSALRAAQVWLSAADQVCGSREPVCLRSLVFNPNVGVLDGMPRVKALLSSWGQSRFLKYMTNAEVVANGQLASGTYTTTELLQTYQLMEYAETFMQRFDLNADEGIELKEALSSFPVYGPTINNLMMGGAAPEDLVRAVFTFMLKYGDTPDNMFGGLILFANWQLHKDSWALSTERDNLMSILAELHSR